MISVALAAYQGEDYIEAQLRSILPQLEQGDEIIVSDDKPGGATERIVRRVTQWMKSRVVRAFRKSIRKMRDMIRVHSQTRMILNIHQANLLKFQMILHRTYSLKQMT